MSPSSSFIHSRSMLRHITRCCLNNDRYHLNRSSLCKHIRAIRPILLQRGDDIPSECFAIVRHRPNKEEPDGLFIFQDANETRTAVVVFEAEEDAQLFTNMLAADCESSASPAYAIADTVHVVDLCDTFKFSCLLQPKGSLVTPQTIEHQLGHDES